MESNTSCLWRDAFWLWQIGLVDTRLPNGDLLTL